MTKKVFAAAILAAGIATMNVSAKPSQPSKPTGSVVCMNLAKANASVTTVNNKIVQYTINPGGNPNDIELQFVGASRIYLDLSGRLVMSMNNGEFRTYTATFYQTVNGKKKLVAGNFRVLSANRAQFQVGKFNSSEPLQIDAQFGGAVTRS